jgi:hypothetical protein
MLPLPIPVLTSLTVLPEEDETLMMAGLDDVHETVPAGALLSVYEVPP